MENSTVSPKRWRPFTREAFRAAALEAFGTPVVLAEGLFVLHVVYEQEPGRDQLSDADWRRFRRAE
jgi:hypothetical protein